MLAREGNGIAAPQRMLRSRSRPVSSAAHGLGVNRHRESDEARSLAGRTS